MMDHTLTLPTDEESEAGLVVLHGIDVVSIDRLAALLDEFGASFRRRVFTESERVYCEDQGDPPQHYAARWAAKEAFLKVLDDETSAVPLATIEVERSATGPQLSLASHASDVLAETLNGRGVPPPTVDTAVSLSHDRTAGYAIGSVTVVGIPCNQTHAPRGYNHS